MKRGLEGGEGGPLPLLTSSGIPILSQLDFDVVFRSHQAGAAPE